MQHGCCNNALLHLLCLWLCMVALPTQASSGGVFSSNLIHRFSDEAKELMKARNDDNWKSWPSFGSSKYYQSLHKLDRARHARKLSKYDTLVFFDGNETAQLVDTFGWIFYTIIELGTPNKTFLVALDSGSDLTWVPCECKSCAPLSSPMYPGLVPFMHTYSPVESATSKRVNCNEALCQASGSCNIGTSQCNYSLQYLSSNTSTSGILVEDVVNFSPGDVSTQSAVSVPIVFGCGEEQTGSFLDGGAPDGLLGLGLGEISVPSILAGTGLVQNSFSMCFGLNNSGRIFFGDKGNPAQQTTSFTTLDNTSYTVEVEEIVVGSSRTYLPAAMIFDSGTSYTYFAQKEYLAVTKTYDSQINLPKLTPPAESGIPFEFCYELSASNSSPNVNISLTFAGGANLLLFSPYIYLADANTDTIAGFCLAILPSSTQIIGVNALAGYWIVFDRDAMKLGWIPSDCDNAVSGARPTSAPAPSPGFAPTTLLQPPTSAPSVSQPSSSPMPTILSPPPPGAPPPTPLANSDCGTIMEPHMFLLLLLLLFHGPIQILVMNH